MTTSGLKYLDRLFDARRGGAPVGDPGLGATMRQVPARIRNAVVFEPGGPVQILYGLLVSLISSRLR